MPINKRVTWNEELCEIKIIDRVKSDSFRDVYYNLKDYDDFEIEALQDEIDEMDASGRMDEIALAIDRWVESSSNSGLEVVEENTENSSSSEDECDIPKPPVRTRSLDKDEPPKNKCISNKKQNRSFERRLSIEFTPSFSSLYGDHHDQCSNPKMQKNRLYERRVSIELTTTSDPPKKPSRKASMELQSTIMNVRKPSRKPSIELQSSIMMNVQKPSRKASMELQSPMIYAKTNSQIEPNEYCFDTTSNCESEIQKQKVTATSCKKYDTEAPQEDTTDLPCKPTRQISLELLPIDLMSQKIKRGINNHQDMMHKLKKTILLPLPKKVFVKDDKGEQQCYDSRCSFEIPVSALLPRFPHRRASMDYAEKNNFQKSKQLQQLQQQLQQLQQQKKQNSDNVTFQKEELSLSSRPCGSNPADDTLSSTDPAEEKHTHIKLRSEEAFEAICSTISSRMTSDAITTFCSSLAKKTSDSSSSSIEKIKRIFPSK